MYEEYISGDNLSGSSIVGPVVRKGHQDGRGFVPSIARRRKHTVKINKVSRLSSDSSGDTANARVY